MIENVIQSMECVHKNVIQSMEHVHENVLQSMEHVHENVVQSREHVHENECLTICEFANEAGILFDSCQNILCKI
jgi:hypothetical protein